MILKKIKTKYGPRADLVKWVYSAIVRPRVLYAYYIWGHRVSKSKTQQALQRLNNLACKLITPVIKENNSKRIT